MPGGYAVSWSGGKDAALALFEAELLGLDVRWLVSMTGLEGVSHAHQLPERLLDAQAKAIGRPLRIGKANWEGYEVEFKRNLCELKPHGIRGCVFGDIYLQEHRQWCVRVCSEIGISAIHPLWGSTQEDVLKRFLAVGFEAVIISVDTSQSDRSWLGKTLSREACHQFLQSKISPCGELGEYHTLVVNGPIFREALSLDDLERLSSESSGTHAFFRFKPFPGT